jgi:hypothetical protein
VRACFPLPLAGEEGPIAAAMGGDGMIKVYALTPTLSRKRERETRAATP